jgi:hypothetical protein
VDRFAGVGSLGRAPGVETISPPPVLTDSLTDDDRDLIKSIMNDFEALTQAGREVLLTWALPQFIDE